MNFDRLLDTLTVLHTNEIDARGSLNLVPSEASPSAMARLPLLLDPYNRYLFDLRGDDERREFRGAQTVAKLERDLAIPLLQRLLQAKHVDVRPLSGMTAMLVVLAALGGKPGETVVSIDPANGGHPVTANMVGRLGYTTAFIGGPDAHTIDMDGAADVIGRIQPSLVYVDQCSCLFPLNVGDLVRAVNVVSPHTKVHVDASHWLGLIMGGQMSNPLACGATSFGGSTHKTFPGPQKGLLATNDIAIYERFDSAAADFISSHHLGATLSLGLAALEFVECGGRDYTREVVANTHRLGRELQRRGLIPEAHDRGFGSGHQLWLRPSQVGVDASTASDRLYASRIRVNASPRLPGLGEPALRMGLNEATYHGLQEDDMGEVADVMVQAIVGSSNPSVLGDRIASLRGSRRSPHQFRLGANRDVDRILTEILSVAFDLPLLQHDEPRESWTNLDSIRFAPHIRELSESRT